MSLGDGLLSDLDLLTIAKRLHEAADETNDAHDHDEYHAAGAVLELITGLTAWNEDYIARWMVGLYERATADEK